MITKQTFPFGFCRYLWKENLENGELMKEEIHKRQRNGMFKVPDALAMPYTDGVIKHLTQ